jgi:hypothetical protein
MGEVALSVFGTGGKLLTRDGDAVASLERHGHDIPLVAADAAARLFDINEYTVFSNMVTRDGTLVPRWGVMEHTPDGPQAVCEPTLSEAAAREVVRLLELDTAMSWDEIMERLREAGHSLGEAECAQPRVAMRP